MLEEAVDICCTKIQLLRVRENKRVKVGVLLKVIQINKFIQSKSPCISTEASLTPPTNHLMG